MLLAHRPTKLLIVGKSGCGKSTFAKKFIIGSEYEKKFVFDHEGEFSERLGIVPCYSMEDLQNSVDKPYTIFDPVYTFEGALPEAFDFFLEWIFEVSREMDCKKLFACDELQKLVGTNIITPALALVIETGRRYGIDTLMVAQQPNAIHNRIRNQQTDIVSFQMLDKNALNFLEDVGFDTNEVSRLDRGKCLHLDLDTGDFQNYILF